MATDFSSKTVIELRKIAKTYGVKLGAGVSKTDIIDKLVYALGDDFEEEDSTVAAPKAQFDGDPTPVQPLIPQPAPAAESARPAAPAAPAQPQYRAAWHNPQPRYNSKPAYQAPAPNYQSRPAWTAPTNRVQQGGDTPPHLGTVRPANYTPRFGPAASNPPAPHEESAGYRPANEMPRQTRGFGPGTARPAYGEQRPVEPRPAYTPVEPNPTEPFGQRAFAAPRREMSTFNQELGTSNPAVSELLAAGECLDGSGVLELHPDGYGFLRSETFLPSSRDIYVSMAQIRRFCLKTGDLVTGKTRPQQGGDKYTAMLYITEVNGMAPDEVPSRRVFDTLTPLYPTRRMSLSLPEGKTPASMRVVDLITPMGFGQRALVLCPPECGKSDLIRDFANVITAGNPDAAVMVLLIDETPEDVTLFRDQVDARCHVLASTFDQAPENHLRLADIVLERAMRLAEQQKDVVLIVDSLTKLAKTYTTTAAQQGRAVPGLVNPTSLFRAKRMFGAARCIKEGGSLTMIGLMDVATGNKVDDTVVEEFKGTANLELVLDASLARTGVSPAINLHLSAAKRAETLLTPEQAEGLRMVRTTFASSNPTSAMQQLLPMIDKTAATDELVTKMKDWLDLMRNGRTPGIPISR